MPPLSFPLKYLLVIAFFLGLNSAIYAQSNFYKLSAGGGYGLTLTFADAKKTDFSMAAYANLDFYLTHYFTIGLEMQKGMLKGGEVAAGNRFVNNYATQALNGKIYLGQFLSRDLLNNKLLNTIRGMYVGSGIGLIRNDVNNVNKGTTTVNKDVIFPFSGGINFYFKNKWNYSRFILNLNGQIVTSLEDGMDGDLNPYSNFNDIYNYFSVGFKYNFGPVGLDWKR